MQCSSFADTFMEDKKKKKNQQQQCTYLLYVLRLLELDNFRNMDWVPINTVLPWPVTWCSNGPVTLPDRGITLEPAPERDLPNPVAFLHPPFGLDVIQFVPQRRRRGVTESVKGHSGCLHVLRR